MARRVANFGLNGELCASAGAKGLRYERFQKVSITNLCQRFLSGDICFVQTTIDYCELARSRRGKGGLRLLTG